jgi:aromatic ring-opening dioxygenase LigB subunit
MIIVEPKQTKLTTKMILFKSEFLIATDVTNKEQKINKDLKINEKLHPD